MTNNEERPTQQDILRLAIASWTDAVHRGVTAPEQLLELGNEVVMAANAYMQSQGLDPNSASRLSELKKVAGY